MKNKILAVALLLISTFSVVAQTAKEKDQAVITFKKTTIDLGTFSEKSPKVSCVFHFTNTGTHALIIHQAIASCGCTVPTYTKEPILPGKTGEIKIKYNGKGKIPGRFKKSITVYTNAKPSLQRLYITGTMLGIDDPK
ncbi:MAG: DUF1573 domain-containing protein [Bacteroidaceae bacterium]|nr:DUF1573 domain-containing protein [Bacteroidaceae bacterium]